MNDFSDDFIDDINDDYDGGDDFTDETQEEEHADEGPVEHEIEEAHFEAPSWESIAFFGAMAEEISEERRIKEMLEKQSEEEDDIP